MFRFTVSVIRLIIKHWFSFKCMANTPAIEILKNRFGMVHDSLSHHSGHIDYKHNYS